MLFSSSVIQLLSSSVVGFLSSQLTIGNLSRDNAGFRRAQQFAILKVVPNLVILYITLVRVIAKKILRDFWQHHADSEQALKAWHKETQLAIWKSPADTRRIYPSASFLPNDRVVFNIKGNNYRLVVAIRYDFKIVFIRFIGTHSQYDSIDARTI
jgi:mRNA interferase HigB